ncbi:DNA glycosylase [Sorangium cellulosum]|uniref:DNA-(apurinic or apyrimidinic site) lyase n=1 Tax=Sorangium cellulosum TaxID=56 RepID=A0A2L0EU53_SORCE|nr:DNA-formamidopyrimidine glycosylase family protein [Sorangium cellulosum]AUX42814.1 DNA glycosylase [Sorangium cellulosum]
MPEGDTLFRIAAALGPALEGARVLALELPRSDRRGDRLVGRRVERVEARGKNLLIFFDDGIVLHTHLRMSGAWHLYREGERWKRSEASASVILAVPGYVAVCFRAPIVRLLRASSLRGDALLGSLGPDLLADGFDPAEALRRLRALDEVPLGVAIMDQRVVAGIGNVYKSELLFRKRLDPFAPVRVYSDGELSDMIDLGRRLLQANVEPRDAAGTYRGPTGHYLHTRTTRTGFDRGRRPVSVYGREGHACYECGAAVQMRRQGTMMRSTYFCPRCQPPRAARSAAEPPPV